MATGMLTFGTLWLSDTFPFVLLLMDFSSEGDNSVRKSERQWVFLFVLSAIIRQIHAELITNTPSIFQYVLRAK